MANIGQMEVELADMEARNIRNEADRTQSIGSTIGAPIQASLGAAENIVKLEESTRLKEENRAQEEAAKALLASGVEGIASYAQSMGFSPEDVEKYRRMAGSVKDEKGFMAIYELMKKQADKQLTGAELTGFSEGLQASKGIEDDNAYEKFINEQNIKISEMKSPEARKDARETLKRFEEQKASRATSRSGGVSQTNLQSNEDKLRGEIGSATKDAAASISFADRALTLGKAALRNPRGQNTSADIALIMSFNKLLDPGSVVREGEYARSEQSQGVFKFLEGYINSMSESGGAKLTDSARRNIIRSMESMKALYKLNILEKKFGIGSISIRRGQNVRNVIPDISREDEALVSESVKDGMLLTENPKYIAKRKALIDEAFTYAYEAAREKRDNEAAFIYKGPNELKKFMKSNKLKDSDLFANSDYGVDVTSEVTPPPTQNKQATTQTKPTMKFNPATGKLERM